MFRCVSVPLWMAAGAVLAKFIPDSQAQDVGTRIASTQIGYQSSCPTRLP